MVRGDSGPGPHLPLFIVLFFVIVYTCNVVDELRPLALFLPGHFILLLVLLLAANRP
jgi:hypothetical protein